MGHAFAFANTENVHAQPDIAIVLDNILWPDAAIAAVTFAGWRMGRGGLAHSTLSPLVKITPELT